MRKMKMRKSILLVLAVVAVFFVAGTCTVNAEMGDRTAAGSIAISPNGVVSVPEGKEVKLNFGTNYDYSSFYYIKFKASKTGYITFRDDFSHGYSVVLCNTKKKVISAGDLDGELLSWDSSYDYQTYIRYGVQKGKTYLIRLKGASTERFDYNSPYIGTVKWTSKAVKQHKYGKKKNNAVLIKKKKKVKGVIVAGSTKPHWYKIKGVKKNSKVYISSKNHCGIIKAEITGKDLYTSTLRSVRHDSTYKDWGTFISANKKTTYYIKVMPDKKSSGEYVIWWQ